MVDRLSKAEQNQSVLLEIVNSVFLSEEKKKTQTANSGLCGGHGSITVVKWTNKSLG